MDQAFWDQMASLENRMEAMLRSFGMWTPGRARMGILPPRPYAPAMDVFARDGDTVLRFDLPGIDPAKDVSIKAAEGALTVHGERREQPGLEDKDYYRRETFRGQFERHVPLPEGTPRDRIAAEYQNGVLEILIPAPPKAAERKPKAIPVKSGTAARTRVPARG